MILSISVVSNFVFNQVNMALLRGHSKSTALRTGGRCVHKKVTKSEQGEGDAAKKFVSLSPNLSLLIFSATRFSLLFVS